MDIRKPPAARRLIINADDFGLTAGVNRAILELNATQVLPSATLMATGAAFRDAVHGAFQQTTLGVGCHVLLLDGESALPPRDLPTLAPGGRMRSSLNAFMVDLFAGRIHANEIEREATAQIRAVQSAGLTVTHVDTHKHAHMFPRVLSPVLRAARTCGVGAIRNPFEPSWSTGLTRNAPRTRRLQVRALRLFHRHFLRAVRSAGLRTTDGALGVLATGTFDVDYVLHLLHALRPGTWELVSHPGYADADLGRVHTRLIETRDTERDALLRVLADPPAGLPRIDLMHYGELQSDGPAE